MKLKGHTHIMLNLTCTSGRFTSGRTSSAWICLAGGLLQAPRDRGDTANGGGGSAGPCCWRKSMLKHRPPSGDIFRSPSSDMPRENSSMPLCRSVRTVKSTSASKLDVELTVMLEHFRSMPRWVSFRYRISGSWSSSETEPRRFSHGSLCRREQLIQIILHLNFLHFQEPWKKRLSNNHGWTSYSEWYAVPFIDTLVLMPPEKQTSLPCGPYQHKH